MELCALLAVALFGAAILFVCHLHERSAQPEGISYAERPDEDGDPDTLLLASKLDGGGEKRRGRARGPATPAELKERAHAYLFRETTVRKVWGWLERLAVSLRDRKDVSQDIFKSAVESWHTYDPKRARPERWLNQITVHVAAHYRDRALHRREELGFEWPTDDDTEPEDPAPSVLDRMSTEQRRRLVLEAIMAIENERLRVVLVAHDVDELPMAEIAKGLSVPLSTAYKWRARALDNTWSLHALFYRRPKRHHIQGLQGAP